jgi:hypothetical protein
MSERELEELIERSMREIKELKERLAELRKLVARIEANRARILDRGDDDPYYGVPV